MWSMVVQRLSQITPSAATPDQLWKRVEAVWYDVPQEHIQSLFELMPRRVASVISHNDGYYGYGFWQEPHFTEVYKFNHLILDQHVIYKINFAELSLVFLVVAFTVVGCLVVRALDSRPEGPGLMPMPPNTLRVHSSMPKLWRWRSAVSSSIVSSGNFAEIIRTVTSVVFKKCQAVLLCCCESTKERRGDRPESTKERRGVERSLVSLYWSGNRERKSAPEGGRDDSSRCVLKGADGYESVR
ncbi:transposable element Tcb1 transposase [Trichonephila clavipes]|nr:transposable element Tcb1 transposase [Trichonephila clavipes]